MLLGSWREPLSLTLHVSTDPHCVEGYYMDARSAFATGIKLDPSREGAYLAATKELVNEGKKLCELGRFSEAGGAYRKAMELNLASKDSYRAKEESFLKVHAI